MLNPTPDYIRSHVAETKTIYQRGVRLYEYGAYTLLENENGHYVYEIEGSYGDYTIEIELVKDSVKTACNCPYPGAGCKHVVAALMDVNDIVEDMLFSETPVVVDEADKEPFLTAEEIRLQALEDRRKRAKNENMTLVSGDMYKGEHQVKTMSGQYYTVALHDPKNAVGRCSCPDYLTNGLDVCKHILFVSDELKKRKDFAKKIAGERFPFVDVYWHSGSDSPRMFHEFTDKKIQSLKSILAPCFNDEGEYIKTDVSQLADFFTAVESMKSIHVEEVVYDLVNERLDEIQMERARQENPEPDFSNIKTTLYPYQKEGVLFGLYRKALLIGDEMGLGKTLQAIVLAVLKKEIFDFEKVLVISPASLKEQWKREIEKFTDEKATVIWGNPDNRRRLYQENENLFIIANYESVLRDGMTIARFRPDLVILDEAQRIKNFNTKTADAVKRIPRKHAIVLTGTPLENRLEDVYSIVQFLDMRMLAPLWKFTAEHFMLSRTKKGNILGYRNLESLHEKLKTIVIRRKKEDVLQELPKEIVNNYYVDLTAEQRDMHSGFAMSLSPLLNKKFLTPLDHKKIMSLLLCMRRVCDSTFLIDNKTNISPKLRELRNIIDDLVIRNNRKAVIFSEWTTMTYLIAKELSKAKIRFVEMSGKIPVTKRQSLIDEFNNSPECKVFLSTEAGGSGLNLQAADCVVNFELPWNPAKMNQRIGRVSRIGQKSGVINVVNIIAKNSIEEKILTGIQLKADLFRGVMDGVGDEVVFDKEKRAELLQKLRDMIGGEPKNDGSGIESMSEIPEDLPYFANPEVLRDEDNDNAEAMHETEGGVLESAENGIREGEAGGANREMGAKNESGAGPTPEKMEEALNSGLQFLSGVLEMATGKKLEATEEDKMITIDRKTGEVTMKFKLPGF